MTLGPSDLCEAFRDRAEATHELIRYSYSHGIGVSEETITEVNLVELNRRLPPLHVRTAKFTKQDESAVSGADFLLTVGRPGRWVSLLVQAKLARPGDARVPSLHHGKGSQRELLVSYAAANRFVPVYVVYFGLGDPSPGERRKIDALLRLQDPCAAISVDPRQKGCLLVRARTVALMQRDRQTALVRRLLEDGRPWASLFCCADVPKGQSRAELADVALAAVKRLPIDAPDPRSPGGRETKTPDDLWNLDESALITGQLPPIAQAALDGAALDAPPAIGAVTIVSSEPLAFPPRRLEEGRLED